jgi:hypothetical protein
VEVINAVQRSSVDAGIRALVLSSTMGSMPKRGYCEGVYAIGHRLFCAYRFPFRGKQLLGYAWRRRRCLKEDWQLKNKVQIIGG